MRDFLATCLLIGNPHIPPERFIAYEGNLDVLYFHQRALLDQTGQWTPVRGDGRGYLVHKEAIESHQPRHPVFGAVYRIAKRYGEFIGIQLVNPIREGDLVNQLVEEARSAPSVY